MVEAVLIGLGAGLMLLGVGAMAGWISGSGRWAAGDGADAFAGSKGDRLLTLVTFTATVLAPLFFGALLIVYGLHRLR